MAAAALPPCGSLRPRQGGRCGRARGRGACRRRSGGPGRAGDLVPSSTGVGEHYADLGASRCSAVCAAAQQVLRGLGLVHHGLELGVVGGGSGDSGGPCTARRRRDRRAFRPWTAAAAHRISSREWVGDVAHRLSSPSAAAPARGWAALRGAGQPGGGGLAARRPRCHWYRGSPAGTGRRRRRAFARACRARPGRGSGLSSTTSSPCSRAPAAGARLRRPGGCPSSL